MPFGATSVESMRVQAAEDKGEIYFMKNYSYKTHGTCSREITFESDGKIVHNVSFGGGCNGNTQGVARLVEGMDVDRVIELLKDIDCNGRGTSCPAQLAEALKAAKEG